MCRQPHQPAEEINKKVIGAGSRREFHCPGTILFPTRQRRYVCIYLLYMSLAHTRLVKWGNSQAIRIPKGILDQAQVKEGDEIRIRVENGRIALEPVHAKVSLESLVEAITPENRHGEQDWGRPVGKELW
jgi:antitoxin MazE